MKIKILLPAMFVLLSYAVAASVEVALYSPSGGKVNSCTIPGSGGTCSFQYVFGCREKGSYYTDSPAYSTPQPSNVFECQCTTPDENQCTGGNFQVCTQRFKWNTISPSVEAGNCFDGYDNDCDGLTDCADPDCASSLAGTVTGSAGIPIDGAKVEVKDESLKTVAVAYTSSLGHYEASGLCGTYSIIASGQDYVPSTRQGVKVYSSQAVEDFQLTYSRLCESDCTYTGDSTVHKGCDGTNGCAFYDAQAALVCDLAQPGWIRDYNTTQKIQCAEGTPYEQAEVKAMVTCAKENLIKTTTIVNYLGKLVKMIVVTCG